MYMYNRYVYLREQSLVVIAVFIVKPKSKLSIILATNKSNSYASERGA